MGVDVRGMCGKYVWGGGGLEFGLGGGAGGVGRSGVRRVFAKFN